jgi:S1-C subfamily serine protease
MNNKKNGDVMSVGILRDGKLQEVNVTLETRPNDMKQ